MKGRIFFGILVVVVGVLLLLMALDLCPHRRHRRAPPLPSRPCSSCGASTCSWPRSSSGRLDQSVLIAIASVVQLMLLDVLRWAYVWPIGIILIGVAIIAGGAGYHGKRKRRRERPKAT